MALTENRPFPLGRMLLYAACAPILLLLVLPTLIIVPMALTKGQLIQFPPIWISIHSFTSAPVSNMALSVFGYTYRSATCLIASGPAGMSV